MTKKIYLLFAVSFIAFNADAAKPAKNVNVINTPSVTVTNPQTSVTVDNAENNPVPVKIVEGTPTKSSHPIRYLWMANSGLNDNGTCSMRLQSLEARQEIFIIGGTNSQIAIREIGSTSYIVLLNAVGNQSAIDMLAQTFVAVNGLTGDLAEAPINSNGLLDCEDWNRKVLGIPEVGN